MADIRVLLEDAAGVPLAPLDMVALQRRASKPRRRFLIWVASLTALVGVGVPAGTAIVSALSSSQRVRVGEPVSHPIVSTPPAAPDALGSPGASASTDAASTASNVADGSNQGALGNSASSSQPPGSLAAGPAEGCTPPADQSANHPGGLGSDGPSWQCDYMATQPGGYRGNGEWTIIIRRGGQTIQFDSTTAPSCGATGTILPGDAVTAHLGTRVPGSQGYVIAEPPGTGPTSAIYVGGNEHC